MDNLVIRQDAVGDDDLFPADDDASLGEDDIFGADFDGDDGLDGLFDLGIYAGALA